jgi:hypothetical protein
MASEVDIANLALSHLGDDATIASLDPPEGSAQAEHCARFYPMARDSLLEMHSWRFATRRTALAELTNTWPQWAYAYAKPADCLRVISVIDPEAPDDLAQLGVKTAKPFTVEINDDLAEVILTNQTDAVLRYVARTEDTTKFPPLFTMALSWHLASMIAGPVLKGDAGAAEAKRCTQVAQQWLARALASDADHRKVEVTHVPEFIAARGLNTQTATGWNR